jgi:DNA-binding transcriptional LysR family regulator
VHGTLRIRLPLEFGAAWLGQAIAEFALGFTDIQLDVDASGRPVDLIDDAFDIAIAFGRPKPSRLTFRRLGTLPTGLYASPLYLQRRGTPDSVDELREHDCVVTEIQQREGVWAFRSQSRRRSVAIVGRHRVNSGRLARELVLGGAGLGVFPSLMCDRYVATGELVRVLPTWSSPPLEVVALILSRTQLPRKTRVFLDFIAERLASAATETPEPKRGSA